MEQGSLWSIWGRPEHALLFDLERGADVLYNLGRCGGRQANDALGLGLLDKTSDWTHKTVSLGNLCHYCGLKRSRNAEFEPFRYSGRKEWPHWHRVSNNICDSSTKVGDHLRDTVGLVDRNETDTSWDVFHLLDEPLVVEPLRGAVHHSQLASTQLLVDGLELVPGFGRVYAFSGYAALLESIDLVLH